MSDFKRFFACVFSVTLLFTYQSLTAQNLNIPQNPLAQLQTQAKKDIQVYKTIWPDGQDILPAVLAITPLLRIQAVKYADEIEAAVSRHRPVFPYNAEEVLTETQQQAFREFAQYLREGKYTEATNLMDKIGYQDWDFLRKTRGTNYKLAENVDKFLREEIPTASREFNLASFFEVADPEMEKLLEPYIKQLRTLDGWQYPAWRESLSKSQLAKKFASKEEFEQFVELLESTNSRFIYRDLEANYALSYIKEVRDIILHNSYRGIKPSSFFMRSVKTTCSFLFRNKSILAITAVALIGISAIDTANAQDNRMARRIQSDFNLFLNATSEELSDIANNETAKQTVVEMTDALHQVRQLLETDPAAFSDMKKRQAEHNQHFLIHQLRNVSAY